MLEQRHVRRDDELGVLPCHARRSKHGHTHFGTPGNTRIDQSASRETPPLASSCRSGRTEEGLL